MIPAATPRRVAVDLTPVLAGGENGGAKTMALELLRYLARAAPECEFILLTRTRSHEELALLDSHNMSRLCVDAPGRGVSNLRNLSIRLNRLLHRVAPPNWPERVSAIHQKWSKGIPLGKGLVRSIGADLLFCPFTAPDFAERGIPVVSIVHDLQYRYYPQFFDPAERIQRERSFREACRSAACLICFSQYVHTTILESAQVHPERIEIIPILLAHRLDRPSAAQIEKELAPFRLAPDRFLLYPANFWAHKNHETLLDAFRQHLSHCPGSDLKLALTGAPGARRDLLIENCRRDPVLSGSVVFTGYVPEHVFSALLYASRAIVFPSLFEGFGMPLLEGMAAEKPLLVSDLTSLPEIAGAAALYFNPIRPSDIAAAIQRLELSADLRRHLANEGRNRLATFGGPEEMAARYLRVFRRVLSPASKLLGQ